jgi:hypothetical protein
MRVNEISHFFTAGLVRSGCTLAQIIGSTVNAGAFPGIEAGNGINNGFRFLRCCRIVEIYERCPIDGMAAAIMSSLRESIK